jgi:integrase
MASIQKRGKTFSCVFYWRSKRQWLTLGAVTEKEADNKAAQIDYLLMRIKQGLVDLPAGIDIVEFVELDGKLPAEIPPKLSASVSLDVLRDKYLAAHVTAHESSSLLTTRIHFRHFAKSLGEQFPIAGLSLSELQKHIDRRATAQMAPATIRKEIHTLRAAWNWGRRTGLVTFEFPGSGLVYNKAKEKPPFQTRKDIERKIARGGLTDEEVGELWDSLYLLPVEVTELLAHVSQAARYPWIYPALCLIAHTGIRRSEVLRAQIDDVDFQAGAITVKEKKRVRGKLTTRRVPLSSHVTATLKKWIEAHPGGKHLFCRGTPIARSRTRRALGSAITRNEFHDHFCRTLAGSKWQQVSGAHTLRHSFISALASAGVDQRVIDEFAGHSTEEQRRRYRHLFPDKLNAVIAGVFG